MSQPSNFEKKVRLAIEKTGLPTEIMATKILTENGWGVENEFPYVDAENSRLRTLDIKANRYFSKKGESPNLIAVSPNSLEVELYIECKKSEKPWVFYLDTMTHTSFLLGLKQELKKGEKTKSILEKIPLSVGELDYEIGLSHHILYMKEKTNKTSNSPQNEHIIVKVEEDKDEIYSAEMQILKALKHQEEKDNQVTFYKRKKAILPIILLNGNLFGCFYENGELKTPRIQFTRHLTYGLPNQQIPALLDVVTLDYFPEYVKRINVGFTQLNS